MLPINLRHLDEHEIHVQGELPSAKLDLCLNDEMMRAEEPLHYDLTVEQINDALLVSGSLRLVLDCQCVRCLKPFKQSVDLPDWTIHLPLAGDDKVPVNNDCIDLTPFIREDMLLQMPRHPLCRTDCGGLKRPKALESAVKGVSTPIVWAELDKLKLK